MAVIEDKPFSIHVEGDATGKTWTGDFRAKIRLSRRDIITRDRIRREMLGSAGGTPDQHASDLALAYAELKVRITDAPPWFVESDFGLDMEDESPMAHVYQKALKVQTEEIERKLKDAESKAAEMKAEKEKENG